MKIPFTLEAWLKDTSQKVVDKDGRPVRIICTDADGLYPIIGLLDNKTPLPCGKDGRPPYIGGGGGTLFLVTPEPELSEFGMKVSEFAEAYELAATDCESEEYKTCNGNLQLIIDKYAPELFAIAIDANAKELYKGLRQSNLDKDSIPYHLIEFMCNLYTCRNWKEIEKIAEAYETRIKAAAMKGLPRWKKDESFETEGSFMGVKGREFFVVKDGYSISVAELFKKLPGFKEDESHE